MTNPAIRALEPKALWNNFANLNAIPRPSKKEERVIAFMKAFGERLNLETVVDAVGNVLIKKPATTGMENRKTVVMQSHLDMVHQKNSETVFDFDSQGIDMHIEGDWVKAKGTTLGADNGLGVATIMAVLESDTIAHPDLEALFTIDEETGMTGAMELNDDFLTGEILLNLDTEEDDEIGVGCAGGVDVTATRTYKEENTSPNMLAYQIKISGLQGGHSGMDIHKGLGNANKLMNRLLLEGQTNYGMRISTIKGGGLRNAIPRESEAIVVIPDAHKQAFDERLNLIIANITTEYQSLEPELTIALETMSLPDRLMELPAQEQLIQTVYSAHNGVYRMSPDIAELVETSNNVANVRVKDGNIQIGCLTRSSVESSKTDLTNALHATFSLAGCDVALSGDYPGWAPNMQSPILKVLVNKYEKLNNAKPHVAACHAGLECGILGKHYPKMDMISFGPNIRGAHSPDERASISSVKKYWYFVLEILKDIPERA